MATIIGTWKDVQLAPYRQKSQCCQTSIMHRASPEQIMILPKYWGVKQGLRSLAPSMTGKNNCFCLHFLLFFFSESCLPSQLEGVERGLEISLQNVSQELIGRGNKEFQPPTSFSSPPAAASIMSRPTPCPKVGELLCGTAGVGLQPLDTFHEAGGDEQ